MMIYGEQAKKTCTKIKHLPVSKVFISMTGYRVSRKRGRRIKMVKLVNLISVPLFLIFSCPPSNDF